MDIDRTKIEFWVGGVHVGVWAWGVGGVSASHEWTNATGKFPSSRDLNPGNVASLAIRRHAHTRIGHGRRGAGLSHGGKPTD
jgi:hypothetical protein